MTAPARPSRLLLPVVLLATFMQLLDVTIAQVSIPEIQRDLDAGQGSMQLVLAGYTLTYACSLITAARLGDRYGYRRLFVIGMSVFTLASALCTAAPSASLLVGARLLQGVGSGLMAPQVLSIIQTALPKDRRASALSLFGATMGIASLSGPLLGGVLLAADLFGLGWRLIFLINVPIGLLAIVGSVVIPSTRGEQHRRIDGLGAALLAAGLGAGIITLTTGPEAGWPAWTSLTGTSAVALIALFAVTQSRRTSPLLHPSVLRDGFSRSGIGLVLIFNAGVPSLTYLLFLYLQSGLGLTPLQAALTNAPYAAAAIAGSRLSPMLARRWGTGLLTAAATVLAVAMVALAVLVDTGAALAALLGALAIGGLAFGAFTASVFSLVLARVRPDAVGSASGLLPTAQQLGGTLGITLSGLVYAAAADPTTAFGHALLYEVAVFVLAALLSTRLARRAHKCPEAEPTTSPTVAEKGTAARPGCSSTAGVA